ncbi:MAG: hypothetical protein PHI12_09560 [Dehalococcoidales bacterium]|nr:hypothetical protein [Dehalococcoidales bacterium]
MSYLDDEETLGDLLRHVYRPVSIPSGVKEQVREQLIAEIEGCSQDSRKPWARPNLMVPILVSIAGGLIAYGYWISMTLA